MTGPEPHINKRFPILLLLGVVLWGTSAVLAQNDRKIAEQKKVVADLERKIAEEERQLTKLRTGKKTTEETVRRLSRQIESRSQLLYETEKQSKALRGELNRTGNVADSLSKQLQRHREQYAEMVRDAYRNYRHHNYLTYIFSSRDFKDIARRIVDLREMAEARQRRMEAIASLNEKVQHQKSLLEKKHRSLDSVSQKLTRQRNNLERDARDARTSLQQLSNREKTTLQRKLAQEEQLQTAIATLRKLTKGNKEGASFSSKTSGLRLPVVGGKVKRYKGNMAEIVGPRGAKVQSIYEGKVMDIKQNRITGKYEVYVAHGEYITTYFNLSSTAVAKGSKVARNGLLGTIGSAMNIQTMETEYKIVFGIYPPDPKKKMLAADCFK